MSSSKLTEDQLQYYRELWGHSEEKKKSLCKEEVRTLLAVGKKAVVDTELDECFALMDTNEDGRVEFEEFIKFAEAVLTCDTDEDLKEAFKLFDTDGSGTLDKEEVRQILTMYGSTCTNEDIDEFIKSADINDDGVLSCEEWVAAMQT